MATNILYQRFVFNTTENKYETLGKQHYFIIKCFLCTQFVLTYKLIAFFNAKILLSKYLQSYNEIYFIVYLNFFSEFRDPRCPDIKIQGTPYI